MYSCLKNIQILVSLLKQYNIRHIVISAGTRHTPFVHSVEQDDFFKTYSIVDERSASFFAIGLIEKLREPVAVCSTSGTAAANYVSAANEAFYQQLPLLILTADRNHYYMFQQEEQMIPQEHLYSDVCKKVVTLPHVRDDKDFWYCSRICGEALMELRRGEAGPVHINFIVENDYPVKQGIVTFNTPELPDVKKMDRLTLEDSEAKWQEKANFLKNSKILIVYGQHSVLTEEEKENIEAFCQKYNCVISTDLLSNLHGKYCVPTFTICRATDREEMLQLCPDVLITMNGHSVTEIKSRMMPFKDKFVHWHVSAKGEISDPFKMLPDVCQCSPQTFFKKFAALSDGEGIDHSYYDLWQNKYASYGENGSLNNESIEYSALYATGQYLKFIPKNSLLHIANSNSIRLSNYFTVDESVEIYGNRGSHGIDGSMSAFIGQAHISNKLSFLLIGDLSFFYDMNALWNKYIGNNIRIMICNNGGGAIFHSYPNTDNIPTLDMHIAAEHTTSVKAWTEARGFKYLCATDKDSFDKNLPSLMVEKSDCPIIMEVFTDKDTDADSIKTILNKHKTVSSKDKIMHNVGKLMPKGMKKSILKILK